MTREEILKYINKVVKKEHGKPVTEDNCILDTELDSFSYAIFWLSLENKYGKFYTEEEVNKLDYSKTSIKTIIDKVIDYVPE